MKANDKFVAEAGKIPRDDKKQQEAAYAALREWHECLHYLVKLQELTAKVNQSSLKLLKGLDGIQQVMTTHLDNLKKIATL
jgi:hypothetical protein